MSVMIGQPPSSGSSSGVVNIQKSSSTGSYVNTTGSFTTAASVTITTHGNPVFIGLQDDNSGMTSAVEVVGSGQNCTGMIAIFNGATQLTSSEFGGGAVALTGLGLLNLPGGIFYVDTPIAGTYTYNIQAAATGASASQVSISNCVLVAYEIGTTSSSATPVSNLLPYIPTITGFGSVSNVFFVYKVINDLLYISGQFTPGTTTATQAQVTLPPAIVSSSTKLGPSNTIVGNAIRMDVGASYLTVLAAPSQAYVTFGNATTGQSSAVSQNGSDLTAGTLFSFFANIPI